MYRAAVGELPAIRPPDFVYVHVSEDETELLGLAAGSVVSASEVMVRFGASMPWHRGRPDNVTAARRIFEDIHKEGYRFITIHVRNDNIPMLKLALHLGFYVYGLHRSTDGIYYVEMIREDTRDDS